MTADRKKKSRCTFLYNETFKLTVYTIKTDLPTQPFWFAFVDRTQYANNLFQALRHVL